MNEIFASSKKGSTTFCKILEEKGVFMPTSCDPSTFASAPNVSCDKKPIHSFTYLPSEDRCPSAAPCVSSCEFEDNSHVSVTSTLSSHSSSTSHLHSIVESKFHHLKDSRHHSASMMFRDRSLKSAVELRNETSKEETSKSSHSKSSSVPSSFKCEEDPSHHVKKEIIRPTKTYDLPNHKIIFGKTSGLRKTSSLSHLGTSFYSKSKAKATKHFKSSSKTKPTRSTKSTCRSRSSSGTRHPTLFRLAHGEQPLYLINIVILIILLLLCFFMIKLLYRPFDRGKETLSFFI